MIEVLFKPAEQITAGDIQALIDSEVPEGEQIEFKVSLPANNKSGDPWMSGEGPVGEKAKNELLKETVAFANAYGGALLLGIRESETKPAVAAEINPIPRCADFADRMNNVFRDRVEPQLPRIEIFGVPTKGDSGVVVFRVESSRRAPHRVTKTLVCPVRRADRCEGMSMREIQDMTLNASRGLERLERRFLERSERFLQEFERLKTPGEAFGIRLTAVPAGEGTGLNRVIDRFQIVEGLEEPWHVILHQDGHNRVGSDSLPSPGQYWRPMLRGARAEDSPIFRANLGFNAYREIHCDGLIELGLLRGPTDFLGQSDINVSDDDLLGLFANLVIQADRFRVQAGNAVGEYAVEVEMHVRRRSPVEIKGTAMIQKFGKLYPGSTAFPRYSVGGANEIPLLLNLFYRDLWNHLGRDIGDEEDTLTIQGWPTPDLDE